MEIGLILGSFNPIHIGHIRMASLACDTICDKVLFVVAKQNPWKESYETVDFDTRCDMVQAAIEPFGKKAELCRLEEVIDGDSYSYQVLDLLRRMYPSPAYHLHLIGGEDMIKEIHLWKNFDTYIKPHFSFIAVKRGKCSLDKDGSSLFSIEHDDTSYPHVGEVIVLDAPIIDVSSTLVRAMTAYGYEIYPLVPSAVKNIIEEKHLYIVKV